MSNYQKCSDCGTKVRRTLNMCPVCHPARTAEELIRKAVSETTWSGAEEYVKALKRSGFQFWSQLPELFRGYEEIERANRA